MRWRTLRLFVLLALAGLLTTACKARPKPGDVCGATAMGHGVCLDSSHALVCRAFTWRLDPCGGPVGCTPQGEEARCDQRVAAEGDSCGDEAAQACSADGGMLLRCDGTRMVASLRCRGPRGCFRDTPESSARCDRAGAEIDDPCEAEGSHCSSDGRSILRCAPSHRYVLGRACPGPRGCFRAGDGGESLVCDVSIGDVGEACDREGGAWCSKDGGQENTCHAGSLVKKQGCAKRCAVDWSVDGRGYRVQCDPP